MRGAVYRAATLVASLAQKTSAAADRIGLHSVGASAALPQLSESSRASHHNVVVHRGAIRAGGDAGTARRKIAPPPAIPCLSTGPVHLPNTASRNLGSCSSSSTPSPSHARDPIRRLGVVINRLDGKVLDRNRLPARCGSRFCERPAPDTHYWIGDRTELELRPTFLPMRTYGARSCRRPGTSRGKHLNPTASLAFPLQHFWPRPSFRKAIRTSRPARFTEVVLGQRPADFNAAGWLAENVAQLKDSSLLVSDDLPGGLYRIWYDGR